MKTIPFDIPEIIKEFERRGMTIEPGFLHYELPEISALKHVNILLEAASNGPIKLTAKGYLPTKLVEQIAKTMPTPSQESYLKVTKRFLEQEQISAQRARALCNISKLLRLTKGNLHLSKLGKTYLDATPNEQYLFLLYAHLHFNIGFLDMSQESSICNDIQLAFLQLFRDKDMHYRSSDVYVALLIEAYPQLFTTIEETIVPESYFSSEPIDEFERLFQLRMLKRYLVPFGLAQERGCEYNETYECCKSALCDALVAPINEIKTELILDKKQMRSFKTRIENEALEHTLFEDTMFMLAGCIGYPLPTNVQLAENLVIYNRLLGTTIEKHRLFYETLADSALMTIRAFTQLDTKGRRGDIKTRFESFIDALLFVMPQDRPHHLFTALNIMPEHLIGWLKVYYEIEPDTAFIQTIQAHFGEEVAEDIGALFVVMQELKKASKKTKRVNEKTKALAKECIIAFTMAVMSIYTAQMEY